MAEVFLASLQGPSGFDRDVVVKKIHPRWANNEDVLSLFKDEARLGSRLNHPNIVQVLDYGRSQGSTYLVMEWVEGYNAADVIAAAEELFCPLTPAASVTICAEIARALEHIHQAQDDFGGKLGIVHRDLNPANILMSFSGEVKLTDFGVAAGGHRELKTEHGILRGTFPYMSPEQTQCRPLDGRSDLFSLGICLYEMLTGHHPFADEEDYLTIERIQSEEPPLPSRVREGIDPALDAIVMRCLSKDPQERHDDAQALKSDFDAWLCQTHPHFQGTSALIRLMLGLFPRGMNSGEDLDPVEIELGPTHPGRAQPLLDVSTLERNKAPKPSSWVDRRSLPSRPIDPVRDSSVIRLDALVQGNPRPGFLEDTPAKAVPGSAKKATGPSEDAGEPFMAPSTRLRRSGAKIDSEPSIHPGDSLPPWDRAKLLADIRSQEVITARGGEPGTSSGVHKPLAQTSNRARSIALWIALSIAVSMLLMFAYLAQ